ncbi:MAG: hypothetical protein JSS61_01025 [Verrucomicrobia bacterium]|nr:hypothetical protein [Verrucomicrobiota bacterium]
MKSESEEILQEETPKKGSSAFSEFQENLEKENGADGKIRFSIAFMRSALTGASTPRFRDFWEARRLCLPLFKENIAPKVRTELWSAYIELSNEARRLKEILDEQASFAVEQIELAIQALERDLEHFDLTLAQMEGIEIPSECCSLQEKKESYATWQRELNLLGTLAARVNSLRKEVIKTEMRIRVKNKLLERLSLCGDKVFPRRKELIKMLSEEFVQDVERFIQSQFSEGKTPDVPLYALREEIKQLQSLAKILTLSTHAFTETRLKLSNCWDQLKEKEKEHKKQTQQKRQEFKQNYDLVLEKIGPFAEACAGEMSIEECNKAAAEILELMKTVELGREDVRELREEINKAKRGPFERARAKEAERLKNQQQVEAERRERIQSLKEELQTLSAQAAELEEVLLSEKREALIQAFAALSLPKLERQLIDRLFKQLKDAIDEKREKALLQLSEGDLEQLKQLESVLAERKGRRQEVKAQIEQYRKLLGGSTLDFEKAMHTRELIEEEKALLEKIDTSIAEIEEKIAEIEEI